MKKRFLTPIAAVAVASLTVFGCASSNDTREATAYGTPQNTTVYDDDATTETQGTTATDYGTTETQPVSDTQTGTTYGTETQTQGMETDRMSNTEVGMRDTDLFSEIDNTEQYSVMDLARMDPNFSTFVRLVDQAGLTASLEQMDGPITVFLPTNAAFEELPKERYDYLTNTENNAELVRILQAHVLASEVTSIQFTGRQVIETSQGNQIPVYTEGGTAAGGITSITIGGASIIQQDIDASNGVIHVIDGIIIPEDDRGNTIMD
ncbi:fasciclin domain-containing protein [Cesiribacter andamanensis]|uniref:Immunogenic protein MPT70 n=1 Tax=Cesiribacter andamanensis AMV16 TaxID=1279009 RepID=M7NSW1_9BACT|nr:fasciclin domain-containing protein [Cesiribacter andamanensis]EMR04755.1 Immunogenic protein MPT70 precursor [Cesiribacter andamanensis AMV16]